MNNIIEKCNSDCQTCNGPNKNNCLSCTNETLFLYNGECLVECPNGTFRASINNGQQECKNCSENGDSFINENTIRVIDSNISYTDNITLKK